jgi:hypothetical protein
MFANPTAFGPMDIGPGWVPGNSPEDLYVVDELAEVVKKVPVQAPYDASRRIGQVWASIPFKARSMDIETMPTGDAVVLVERLAAASLSGRLSVDDAFLLVDDEVKFTFTVENIGQTVVLGVAPLPHSIVGDGQLALLSSGVTNTVDLNPGQSISYTSVYLAVSNGDVRVRAIAQGTDAGGTTVSSLPAPADGLPIKIANILEIIAVLAEPNEEIRPGEDVTVRVIIKNNSPLEIENVTPTLTLLTNQFISGLLAEGSLVPVQPVTPAVKTMAPV